MELLKTTPEEVGMSSKRLIAAKDHAEQAGYQLGATGGATLVMRHGKIVGEWYWGQRGLEETTRPWDAETMIPLLSVTKGFTATALALLVEDGLIWLDDPVHLYLPELNVDKPFEGEKGKITIRHLATHSSGFPGGDPDWYAAWQSRQPDEHPYEAYVRRALTRRLVFEPGTDHIYSDPAVCLLGEIIYRVAGQRVPDLMSKRIFEPLGLRRIGWDFDDELAQDIALCVEYGWDRQRTGTKAARQDGSLWGGIIANARDTAAFGLLLLSEGTLDNIRIMSPLSVRMMTTCQTPRAIRKQFPHRGLFWWVKSEPESPELGSLVPDGTYCHGGAGHSVLVVMPELDIVAVMLRNSLRLTQSIRMPVIIQFLWISWLQL